MCSLSFFHYSEYLVTAIINPRSLSLDSFLLNHSVEYTLAAVSSWVEFTVEKLTVPGWIQNSCSLLLLPAVSVKAAELTVSYLYCQDTQNGVNSVIVTWCISVNKQLHLS